jgi:hypothetical protein
MILSCTSGSSISGSLTTDCARITNTPLAGIFQQSSVDAKLYLQQEYDVAVTPESETLVSSTNLTYTNTYYQWSDDAVSYQLATTDSVPRYANVAFRQELPALKRTVQCLGSPAFYSLRYLTAADSRPFLIGELFYTEQGIIVYFGPVYANINATRSDAIALNSSMPVEAVRYVSPNHDVATMDWLALPTEWEPGEASHERYIQQNQGYFTSVLPWPGAIDKMELTYIAPHLIPPSADSPIQPPPVP